MITSAKKNNCTRHGARLFPSWIGALIFSLLFNLALFDLMPLLMDDNPGRPPDISHLEAVHVVRIKRPEPPRRKEIKTEKTPEKPPKKRSPKKSVYTNEPMKTALDLPFEINRKLPVAAASFQVPPMPMKRFVLNPPGLKASYNVGEIDHPLTPLSQAPPIYPWQAKRRDIEGRVKIRFIVDEEGRVGHIEILESHPREIFDDAVVRCVSGWRFKPGTVENIPVKTLTETTIKFKLE